MASTLFGFHISEKLHFGYFFSTLTTPPAGKSAINSCIASPPTPPQTEMASTALLFFLLVATSNIVGAVKVSPPSLHQGGNQTEAEPMVGGSVSWFPAASFNDPCNATQPPDNAVTGPPDDMVCGGVREVLFGENLLDFNFRQNLVRGFVSV